MLVWLNPKREGRRQRRRKADREGPGKVPEGPGCGRPGGTPSGAPCPIGAKCAAKLVIMIHSAKLSRDFLLLGCSVAPLAGINDDYCPLPDSSRRPTRCSGKDPDGHRLLRGFLLDWDPRVHWDRTEPVVLSSMCERQPSADGYMLFS